MIGQLLSGDLPRSRTLGAALALVLLGLALAPFLFPGARSLDVAAKICVFVLLAASYDLLLGYTGIVSFAHTMFFGIGGYGVGLAAVNWGPAWGALAAGGALALLLSGALAFAVGMLSLRVRAIFFAMISLAVAAFFQILASQLSWLTGGEDGVNFTLPPPLHSRLAAYYFVFAASLALFLVLLRVVNSPFGRVLLSIRENEFRAEALGTRIVVYRTAANCIGALGATCAGLLYALWLRYTGPATTLSFDIMVDLLLMVVIGGMGTMYGSVLGATILVLAQSYLRDLMRIASNAVHGVPLLPDLLHPDRWLLWLGVLFIVCVYYFPAGIVGRLRK